MLYPTSLPLSNRQKEFLRIIPEDLQQIRENWDNEVNDTRLRQEAILLRQLLVQDRGMLLIASEWLNTCLKVMGPLPLNQMLSRKGGKVLFYQAGGAVYRGMEVRGVGIREGVSPSPDPAKAHKRIIEKIEAGKCYTLTEYLHSPCFVLEGELVTRINLIKYVCNKMGGGGHFELGALSKKLEKLDNVRQNYIVADKNAVYYELLAIGQALANSPSIQKFEKKLRSVLK